MCYLNNDECKNTLKNFNKCKQFIIAEPENEKKKSVTLNRIPEYSHDYQDIFQSIFGEKYTCMKHNLKSTENNLKSILVFIKK